jgi:hypothetical protein
MLRAVKTNKFVKINGVYFQTIRVPFPYEDKSLQFSEIVKFMKQAHGIDLSEKLYDSKNGNDTEQINISSFSGDSLLSCPAPLSLSMFPNLEALNIEQKYFKVPCGYMCSHEIELQLIRFPSVYLATKSWIYRPIRWGDDTDISVEKMYDILVPCCDKAAFEEFLHHHDIYPYGELNLYYNVAS